jgi:hypothetical protein
MEELLRKAFQLGQQWVHDIEYNPEKEPTSFNDWFNSDEVQEQVKLFCQPDVSSAERKFCPFCKNEVSRMHISCKNCDAHLMPD